MSGQFFFFDQLLRDQTSGDQLFGGQTFVRSISGRSNVRSMIKKESLLFRYLSHFEFLVHSHSRIKVVIFFLSPISVLRLPQTTKSNRFLSFGLKPKPPHNNQIPNKNRWSNEQKKLYSKVETKL